MTIWPYIAGAVVLAGILIGLWFHIPRWMVSISRHSSEETFNREDKLRLAFSGLITSVSVVVGAFVALYQFQAGQSTQRTGETSSIYAESLKLLANKDATPSARAGAIYALQVPLEFDETYHSTVIAVLLTYIKAARSTQTHPGCQIATVDVSPDIQAVINVLGSRRKWIDQEPDGLLDLSQLCLFGAMFNGLNFNNANFHEADLRHATFDSAWVLGANFSAAELDYWSVPWVEESEKTPVGLVAVLDRGHGYRKWEILASFRDAHASGAIFNGACLRGVDFSDASLDGATLEQADLSLAVLRGSLRIDPGSSFARACAVPPALGLAADVSIPRACFDAAPATAEPPGSNATATQQCEVEFFKGFKAPKNGGVVSQ